MYKILQQITKDVKETARVQGNIDENVFLEYCEYLWNTTNINELQLEYNSADYLHASVNFVEVEKVLILTKMVKLQDKITLTQSYTVCTRRVSTEITTIFK